jgi:hypothetical protein
MTYYYKSRYTLVREFIKDVVNSLSPEFNVQINAPTCIEVVLRQRDGKKLVHLVNRASGLPLFENILGTDEITEVGPISVRLCTDTGPDSILNLFESGNLEWNYNEVSNEIKIVLDKVHIHETICID